MKKTIFLLAGILSCSANAGLMTESVDAGNTLLSALTLDAGTTQVNGSLLNDEDLFKFTISTDTNVSISLGSSSFDDNLILFNGLGQGLEGDDDGGSGLDSFISRFLTAGDYFIAVGDNNMYGFDVLDYDFISNDSGALASPTSETLAYLGNSSLSHEQVSGTYSLSFNLAVGSITNSTSVPEPTSIAILGLGLAGIAFNRRKKAV
jgi:hypothetical protein